MPMEYDNIKYLESEGISDGTVPADWPKSSDKLERTQWVENIHLLFLFRRSFHAFSMKFIEAPHLIYFVK